MLFLLGVGDGCWYVLNTKMFPSRISLPSFASGCGYIGPRAFQDSYGAHTGFHARNFSRTVSGRGRVALPAEAEGKSGDVHCSDGCEVVGVTKGVWCIKIGFLFGSLRLL